jgi:NAD(P)-dependent dehydrogenase (short-subunit alcohol dehydrogenase family)
MILPCREEGELRNDLAGRKAVITGGSRGFGCTAARALLHAGADLLLVARGATELLQAAAELAALARPEQKVETCAADLRDPDVAEVLFIGDWSEPDILVNNAGIQGPIGPLWTNSVKAWHEVLLVNLFAPVILMRAVLPGMIGRRWGRIINLSGGGATGPRPNFSAYAASKTALVRVTETLAAELTGTGVTVNAIAPGTMNTDMTQEILRAGTVAAGQKEVEVAERLNQSTGVPGQDAAELCVFLASDSASHVSGKLIAALWDPWRDAARLVHNLASSDVYTLRRIPSRDSVSTSSGNA